MSAEKPTIRPAEKKLSPKLLKELKEVLKEVRAGEHHDPRYYSMFRVLKLLPAKSALKIKLLADIGAQDELTTNARVSVLLNGLYPTQFKFPDIIRAED